MSMCALRAPTRDRHAVARTRQRTARAGCRPKTSALARTAGIAVIRSISKFRPRYTAMRALSSDKCVVARHRLPRASCGRSCTCRTCPRDCRKVSAVCDVRGPCMRARCLAAAMRVASACDAVRRAAGDAGTADARSHAIAPACGASEPLPSCP
ncbi:hypothetical protein [Burkholderia multivorans]|uniref:hypothetical protein n=1 Tax=Burkholderia multivorans TaxID=87883 RepID=UPI0020B2D53D|nr:hypothetical protein [Burkholderia multivorans]